MSVWGELLFALAFMALVGFVAGLIWARWW
jgi:hypothetical protein